MAVTVLRPLSDWHRLGEQSMQLAQAGNSMPVDQSENMAELLVNQECSILHWALQLLHHHSLGYPTSSEQLGPKTSFPSAPGTVG